MLIDEAEIIEKARSLGIVDETKVRNRQIFNAFTSMRENSMKYEEAIYKLSTQFCLGEDSIRAIVRIIGKSKKENKQH